MASIDLSPATLDISLFDVESINLDFNVKYNNGTTVASMNITGWTFSWTAYLGTTPTPLVVQVTTANPGLLRLTVPANLLQGGKTYTTVLLATDALGRTRPLAQGALVIKSVTKSSGAITGYSLT
jgi:hypothetical protein